MFVLSSRNGTDYFDGAVEVKLFGVVNVGNTR